MKYLVIREIVMLLESKKCIVESGELIIFSRL